MLTWLYNYKFFFNYSAA